jgi:hypothetical protein
VKSKVDRSKKLQRAAVIVDQINCEQQQKIDFDVSDFDEDPFIHVSDGLKNYIEC